jgi:hypothetical protein
MSRWWEGPEMNLATGAERIPKLEQENQMYRNYADRLAARVKELEAELAAMKRQPHGPSCTCNDCREALEIEMRAEGK